MTELYRTCCVCYKEKTITKFKKDYLACKKCKGKFQKIHFVEYKKCSKCNIEQEDTEFWVGSAQCKKCHNHYKMTYKSTLHGFLSLMIVNSRTRTLRKKSKNKKDTAIISINKDDLQEIYDQQKGLCYYSGIKMKYNHYDEWTMSIERLDNNIGYTKENTVLCCYEFNSGCQWSLEKINDIKTLISSHVDLEQLEIQVKNSKTRKNRASNAVNKYIEILSDDKTKIKCYKCNNFYPKNQFTRKCDRSCKNCRQITYEQYMKTMKGIINCRINSSKTAIKNRNKKGRLLEHTITYDCIMEKIISQKGRCFYSGIPLVYSKKRDWIISLERLDNNIGYTNENVVLICGEFNSSDTSLLTENKSEIVGSSQWSKEKFNYFMSHFP